MSQPGQQQVLHCNDSKSLWNYTLSPGWTEKEVEVFRLALMKFGLGRWSKIVDSRCLPGKTVAQLNNQMQRMLGQQSTAEFLGLHIDPTKVFEANKLKKGKRKNGCLVNTGDKATKQQTERKKKENRTKYSELSSEEVEKLVIPTLDKSETSTVKIKSVGGVKQARTKLETLLYLQERLKLYENALSKQQSVSKVQRKTSAKAKSTSGRTSTGKRVTASNESTTESDAALALRLQMEEEGGMDICEDDSDDFVAEKPKRKRRRAVRSKRKSS